VQTLDLGDRGFPVSCLTDHFEQRVLRDSRFETGSDHGMVVGDQDMNRLLAHKVSILLDECGTRIALTAPGRANLANVSHSSNSARTRAHEMP
jgi:hypothetical protein